jgi:hypothetical protein
MQSIDQLLLNLGQTAGLPQPLRFDAHGCARLVFDGALAIDFERDSEASVLHIYSVLGSLPAEGREALYAQLLEANLFGAGTQGCTLAVDRDAHEVVLCRTVAAQGLGDAMLVQHVEQVVAAAEEWKPRLAAFTAPVGRSHGEQGRAQALPVHGMLRG